MQPRDFTGVHFKVLTMLQFLPSILSISGSYAILFRIKKKYDYDKQHRRYGRRRTGRQQRQHPHNQASSSSSSSSYSRIMICLALFDIVLSSTLPFYPFLSPKSITMIDEIEEPQQLNLEWSIGNTTTCNVVGFLTQIRFIPLLYNAALSVYFYSTIRYNVSQHIFATRIEPTLHGIAILYPLCTGMIGLIFNLFGSNRGCWVYEPSIALVFGVFPLVGSMIIIIVCNLSIYCYVKHTFRRTHMLRQQSMNLATTINLDPMNDVNDRSSVFICPTNTTSTPIATADQTNNNTPSRIVTRSKAIDGSRHQQRQRRLLHEQAITVHEPETDESRVPMTQTITPEQHRDNERIRQVALQAFLYVGSYFSSYIWSFLGGVIDSYIASNNDSDNERLMFIIYFTLATCNACLFPLQGFWNGLIYCKPRYDLYMSSTSESSFSLPSRRKIQVSSSSNPSSSSTPSSQTITQSRSQSQADSSGSQAAPTPQRQQQHQLSKTIDRRWQALYWSIFGDEELSQQHPLAATAPVQPHAFRDGEESRKRSDGNGNIHGRNIINVDGGGDDGDGVSPPSLGTSTNRDRNFVTNDSDVANSSSSLAGTTTTTNATGMASAPSIQTHNNLPLSNDGSGSCADFENYHDGNDSSSRMVPSTTSTIEA